MIQNIRLARLVTVGVRLEGALNLDGNVVSLLDRQFCQLNLQGLKVKAGDLFIQKLGENVNVPPRILAAIFLLPELELSQRLVGERGGHDERRVTSGASEVEKASLSKEDNAMAILEDELIHLRLDINPLRAGHEADKVDLIVEVANVAHDCIVLHFGHVFSHNDALVSSRCDENISFADHRTEPHHAKSFHGSLKNKIT